MKAHRNRKQRKPWHVEKLGNVAVPIYRREKTHKTSGEVYTVHEVADYTAGIRRLRSFNDPAQAKREAERIVKLLAAGDAAGATLRSSEVVSYGRAVELLRGLDVPLELAASRYAETVKILGGDRIVEAARDFIRRNPTERPARTIAEVTAELVELKQKRGASTVYVEDLRQRLGALAKRFVNTRIDRITTADIQSWLDGMNAAPRTVRNFRCAANSLFKFSEARGYIARGENPVGATERITTKNGEAITIYSPEELTRLLEASPDWFKPAIAIQAFAGLRSAEVMRLNWKDVKLARGHIELGSQQTKTASRRLAPLTDNLAEWLAAFAQRKGKVFPYSRAYFHETQASVAAATAVESDPAKGIGAKSAVEWKKNALRHSFISYRVAAIQNVPQVAMEAGNSPAVIFAHYRELVTTEEARTWFAISPEQAANVLPLAAVANA